MKQSSRLFDMFWLGFGREDERDEVDNDAGKMNLNPTSIWHWKSSSDLLRAAPLAR